MTEGDDDRAVGRREALSYAGGAGLGLGLWRAVDNVLIGYGLVSGTNLKQQDLPAAAGRGLDAREAAFEVGEYRVLTDGGGVGVYDGDDRLDGLAFAAASAEEARALDEEYDLAGGPVEQLVADAAALDAGEVRFEFSKIDPFFDRVADADHRPFTVGAIRGPRFRSVDPEFVGEFTGVDPADPSALIDGLAEAFRAASYYDVPRYAAGSVEDNVIADAHDLRQYFESPTDFEALAAGENSGLFCTELAYRAIEAFHAIAPHRQRVPVAAAFVQDSRHKHAYNLLATVLREDGDLVVAATFVDYTYALLYDDVRLRWLLGEGTEAYDDRHRTTGIYWNEYAGL